MNNLILALGQNLLAWVDPNEPVDPCRGKAPLTKVTSERKMDLNNDGIPDVVRVGFIENASWMDVAISYMREDGTKDFCANRVPVNNSNADNRYFFFGGVHRFLTWRKYINDKGVQIGDNVTDGVRTYHLTAVQVYLDESEPAFWLTDVNDRSDLLVRLSAIRELKTAPNIRETSDGRARPHGILEVLTGSGASGR